MADISKKDPRFLEIQEEKLKRALEIDETGLDLISARVPSVNSISPGNVVSFSYNKSSYMALAASNGRSGPSSAVFRSRGTKNKLFSCFLVDHLSSESLKIIIESLNRYGSFTKIASYRYITNLFGLFVGRENYRTFISTGRMSNLTRILTKGR